MERKFQHLETQIETGDNAYIESLLEKSFETEALMKANEGHNGVILEFNVNGLSPKEKKDFCEYFQIPFNEDEDVAVKMLKLYRAGEAEREFTAQEKASRSINDSEGLQGRVKVPECYFGGEIAITSESLRAKFEASGVDIRTDKFGLIMMDFVEGEDLGIFCYKQFIKSRFDEYRKIADIDPTKEIKPEEYDLYLRGQTVDQLILNCHRILGIRAKYQYFDTSIEAQRERSEIANKILGPIENQGLFDKARVDDLREAIKIMHEGGVVHRDLHLRNIILGNDGNLSIVDFGSAALVKDYQQTDLDNVYRGVGGEIMQKDESILGFLTKLATTPEEAAEKKSELNLDFALRVKRMITAAIGKDKKARSVADKKAIVAWEKLNKNISRGEDAEASLKSFSYDFGQFSGDRMYDYQIAGLMLLAEAGLSDKVNEICESIKNKTGISPVFITKINSLQTII